MTEKLPNKRSRLSLRRGDNNCEKTSRVRLMRERLSRSRLTKIRPNLATWDSQSVQNMSTDMTDTVTPTRLLSKNRSMRSRRSPRPRESKRDSLKNNT